MSESESQGLDALGDVWEGFNEDDRGDEGSGDDESDEDGREPDRRIAGARIKDLLWNLPALEDDLYLKMQATNLALVDLHLRDLERQLLAVYIERERMPLPEMSLVSGLSQMWVFGLYELMRTWRQRANDLIRFAEAMTRLTDAARTAALEAQCRKMEEGSETPNPAALFAFESYRRVVEEAAYLDRLKNALYASEILFRRLEVLRIALAKHEVPRAKGSIALSPGYARISPFDGSMTWFVSLGDYEQDSMSRTDLAESLGGLGEDVSPHILTDALQEKVKPFRKWSYALKRVVASLANGTRVPGVLIAWNKQVVAVLGEDTIPFIAADIVDVGEDETDDERPGAAAFV